MFTYKEELGLIGEIEGITLRTAPNGNGVAVFLRINGKELMLIRDYGVIVDHTITRRGICDLIQDYIS